jgi:hypothetical protein
MGQYWAACNITKEVNVSPSGVKLMEHSWMKNAGMLYVMDKLRTTWY